MVNIIVEVSKYLMIILMTVYTYLCFSIFGFSDPDRKKRLLRKQNVLMFAIHLVAFMVMYLKTRGYPDAGILSDAGGTVWGYYPSVYEHYPRVSRLVVNNMCMLLCAGMIMLTRLDYEKAVKQYVIAAGAIAISLVVPVIIRKFKLLSEWRTFYAAAGLFSLAIVVVIGRVSYGAMLGFSIGGINIQPSELVKIIFVFFVASSFKRSLEFRNIVITTAVAAFHVLILVVSKDLGAALIIFIVYLAMLYVATRQPLYVVRAWAQEARRPVAAYYLFSHVRTRVIVWKDPFAAYDNGGYQVAQSLFAIGTGGWSGWDYSRENRKRSPWRQRILSFLRSRKRWGLFFALCIILVCVSCYIMFLNIAMQLHSMFYKMVALGLGTCYIFQVFLTIGGVTKFIPSTGVTLPLVSYGGSSLVSTLIMFAIIQGLYILREDEEETIERKKKEKLRAARSGQEAPKKRRKAADVPERAQGSGQKRQKEVKRKTGKEQRVR